MGYHPVTPFGRPVESVREVLSARQSAKETAYPSHKQAPCPLDKWQILRDLTTARAAYGLSDRDLTVLQALISFHPATQLEPSASLVVHPSNDSICERAHGMANSTMRRHLARLIDNGLLIRRDSPNGKRYARRMAGQKIAFGFDLRPLLLRAAEFAERAEETRRTEDRLRTLRESVSLLRRDLAALAALGQSEQPDVGHWDALSDLAHLSARQMRRKLDQDSLTLLHDQLRLAVEEAVRRLDRQADELSTIPAQNEQHQQSSDKDLSDSESVAEIVEMDSRPIAPAKPAPNAEKKPAVVPPLRLVLDACTELANFTPDDIRNWPDLIMAAERIRPMTGISESAWGEAKHVMGPVQAAVALAAMLERFGAIRNPGGYLRHLTRQAEAGTFSTTRMVLALKPAAA
ncbi:plasmid replication protein RepC [Pseudooceanicola nanhaiensis]|uniref:plasmid replication protein RepC n=1 Tax=Pseudooceanicola nanhaiensis TaxID=375761 RepID=UPI001CD6413E|nr:plasmid replication protein RepC [Pseudooceanicola nanhaiensis]MCA0922512.1 replication initiation protein [Pseudooceanicola nanhaiensis]